MNKPNYQQLEVWQEAMNLAVDIYRETECFPTREKYGLTSQARRAAVSIASNIAEAHGRFRWGDRFQFLATARGSLLELETQILIAQRLRHLDADATARILTRTGTVARLLNGFMSLVSDKRKASDRR